MFREQLERNRHDRASMCRGSSRIALSAFAIVCSVTTSTALAGFVQIEGGGTYSTIQSAINAAQNGQRVIVHPATYQERINFNGKNIVVRSVLPDDPETVADTIIDGQSLGSVVTFAGGESTGATLEGFTINTGSATYGGGIHCVNGSSPTIRKNVIANNNASINGGGVFVASGANPHLVLNQISNNTCQGRGAGVFLENSSAFVESNTIQSNTTIASSGGGLHIGAGCNGARIERNVIYLNSALYGGGVQVEYSSPLLDGNRIQGNFGMPRGAGLSIAFASPRVVNNVIAGNQCNIASAIDINSGSPKIYHNTMLANRSVNSAIVLAANSSAPELLGNIIAFHDNGFALHVTSNATAIADYNCFFANVDGNTTGSVTLGGNNIYVDPKIVALGTWAEGQIPGGDTIPLNLDATLTGGGATGLSEYKHEIDRERFQVELAGLTPFQTLPIRLNGAQVGQLFIDAQGTGDLDYDTDDGNFPANFPNVHVCDEVTVGDLVSGHFQLIGATIDCDAQIWQPGNERLQSDSPCRKAGPGAVQTAVANDAEGHLRPFAFVSDIGMDETVIPAIGDFEGDDDVDLLDFARLANCFQQTGNASCVAVDFDANGTITTTDYPPFRSMLTGPS